MSAGDVAAIIVSVAAVMAVVGILFALGSLIRTLATVREAVVDLHSRAAPLLTDAHKAIRQASTDLDRVDDLLETAHTISSTVDNASRLAYTAFSSPVVKGLALATGVGRAARRIRHKDGSG